MNVGFDVQTTGRGNISTYNHYRGNGGLDYTTAAVRFAGLGDFTVGTDTSAGAISLGDTFDITTSFTCADKNSNTRVQNRSLLNIVMNAQDLFQIPYGFCGDITIDGNLTVTGSVTPSSSPATLPYSVSYASGTGQAIFFDYAMEVPGEGVYRIGTLNVIHDGSGLAAGITFSETYTELAGPPSQPIALQADFDVGDTITITVTDPLGAALGPLYNFLIRTISL